MIRQVDRSSATIGAIHASARKLFATRGFDATSMDDIAAQAGVAKGALYHHFASKEEIFTQVLDSLQAEIAAAPIPTALRQIPDALDRLAAGVLRYLDFAMQPGVMRILLLDGPVVVGWGKWREIDDRYFGASTKSALAHALGKNLAARELDALAHLVMGAVMEAALVCAKADDPSRSARDHVAALRRMLEGPRSGLTP
jgi:AcrR family transcriptional regulator